MASAAEPADTAAVPASVAAMDTHDDSETALQADPVSGQDLDGIVVQVAADTDEKTANASDDDFMANAMAAAAVKTPPTPPLPLLSRDMGSQHIHSRNFHAMAAMAQTTAQQNRLGRGKKTAFQTKMGDIGELGIGLRLYFMLTKYLAVTFFLMGLVALPTIVLNKAGHGITSKMSDPLQLAYASLGNQGVSPDIASDPKLCLPRGDIDCNGTTVNTPFTSSPVTVSWIITISDCVYSIVFLLFYVVYRISARRAIDEHMNENLTPAKYAVFVKGLPPDATEREILTHFNTRYDLTKEETYSPLWLGCCWGRRRKVTHTLSRNAVNRTTVKNLDHLAGTTSIDKELYLNTWIAEVSIGHPTGGLLRNFLSMEKLTQSIRETELLVQQLEYEKKQSLATFRKRDEKLIHASKKKLDTLSEQLTKQKSKIGALKQASNAIDRANKAEQKRLAAEQLLQKASSTSKAKYKKAKAQAKVASAASAARAAAMKTKAAFDWDACECAFVVFNNLESRRRCLFDYRSSTRWLPHKYQPKELRFRGEHRLVVTPAPEPSNILWENLETTARGRFYRRSLTNLVTFLLLLVSAMIISGAQSAQQQFTSMMPPAGLCDRSLPEVFYGNTSYGTANLKWNLAWRANQTCAVGVDGKPRHYIAYDNGILGNTLNLSNPVPMPDPTAVQRCVDPCISETVNVVCSTLPCFDQDLLAAGRSCETYDARHALYCLCTAELTTHIDTYGLVDGAQRLWNDVTPCRGFIKDYLQKNGFIVIAAAVVVGVNLILDMILRRFADFERHSSESAKATAIALKMFLAQFLNTAVIVLLVNASLGLRGIPVLKELLKGKYRDFERDWYPSVGMGITTTMLINAFVPQIVLCVQMFVFAPLKRWLKRRAIRTQAQMDKLYAGPSFDISVRYPMVLNSLFVTMVFCGGSPILLFIAAVTALGTYWFDKLSLIHLYSVQTAYDEELGELALLLLPWTMVLHLAFSTWMYGNTQLLKSTTIDLPWLLKRIGLQELVDQYGDYNSEELYNAFLERASQVDVLGKYGIVVKVVRSNVMLVFLFFVGSVLAVLLSLVWAQFVYPVLAKIWTLVVNTCCTARRKPLPTATATGEVEEADAAAASSSPTNQRRRQKSSGAAASPGPPPPPPVVLPEFTDVFRKSVKSSFVPEKRHGFCRNSDGELVRMWLHDHSQYGVDRKAGECMRTYEAIQAPVKSYAIEMNAKYRLAVAEIVKAARLLQEASEKLLGANTKNLKTIPEPSAAQLEAEIAETEPITTTAVALPATAKQPKRKGSSSSSSSSDDGRH